MNSVVKTPSKLIESLVDKEALNEAKEKAEKENKPELVKQLKESIVRQSVRTF